MHVHDKMNDNIYCMWKLLCVEIIVINDKMNNKMNCMWKLLCVEIIMIDDKMNDENSTVNI